MNKTALLTAVTLGAGLGLASYLMQGTKASDARVDAMIVADDAPITVDIPALQLAQFQAHDYQKLACRALYGEHYIADGAACKAPVECNVCVTHKGAARNAVIHANTWVRSPKAGGPDYAAMMRQERLVFQMSVASQAATEAGRKAYDHTVRCERLTWRADIQCN